MSRYELGLTLDYCGDWGVVEAVREFFQNALDEYTQNPKNTMFFDYDKETCVLRIGNKLSKLQVSSLLLGATTKRNADNLIGYHGEGYKVATVVLLRLGKQVTVYNNKREVWKAKVVKSRRYNTDICVFDIEHKIFKNDANLVFEISGVTNEEYESIVAKNLNLQENIGGSYATSKGELLLNEKYSGNVYVSGLFVCNKPMFKFGYNFKPGVLKLDRDRGLVDSFNLTWETSGLVSLITNTDFIVSNIETQDLQYLHYFNNAKAEVGKKLHDQFIEEYGDDCIPVNNDDDYNKYASCGYKPRMVSSVRYGMMKDFVTEPDLISDDIRFNEWCERAKEYLTEELYNEIIELWKERN